MFKRLQQRGVVTIEFILGFIVFWMVIVAWLEIAFISYVTAVNDLAINEAARVAKKDSSAYMVSYKSVLDQTDSLWSKFIDPENVIYTVNYVKDITELSKAEQCLPEEDDVDSDGNLLKFKSCGSETGSAIAIYYMSYQFEGLFTHFFDNRMAPAREIIVVQEYQRDKFNL
ncbi:TadE/TadG family type IV pilus assembly protein [Vibrio ulleungensis]|uniref:Pilus assembly protein n=1 Tax=Vibrio ulleungensis TaxID=2807619 RepID=A0ABS2HMW5_9VIBR|nr:TadE family protein [Vibrio ulleungensis]MBM7038389.1 pilus assembly protein [Vibrio ulleungensis]